MTTATQYRDYAQECIDSARDAKSDAVRQQFLDLAKLWLTAAERADNRSAPQLPIKHKGDGHALAEDGDVGPHEPN